METGSGPHQTRKVLQILSLLSRDCWVRSQFTHNPNYRVWSLLPTSVIKVLFSFWSHKTKEEFPQESLTLAAVWSILTKPRSASIGPLTDEKRSEEAALLVHVHSRGVGHSHEQAVAGGEREQPPLVGGVQREVGTAGPAGGPAGLHQQDGNWVGVHLEQRHRKPDKNTLCCMKDWNPADQRFYQLFWQKKCLWWRKIKQRNSNYKQVFRNKTLVQTRTKPGGLAD